ncbi:MAG: nuclear transport factor 2 family protein [Gammaproteobacteria bacterium]|nr:nuclear transport factor 2 family protein [Gammaproteobacteria bacterium]
MTAAASAAPGGPPAWTLIPVADIQTLADKGDLSGAAKDIQDILDRYSQGTVNHDLKAIENCFVLTDDFVIVESSYPNFGWNDFKQNHLLPELEGVEGVEYRADVVQAYATDQLAYAIFKYKAAGSRGGERRTFEGLGTCVLIPTDDGWKIRHWATCSRRPPTHSHG